MLVLADDDDEDDDGDDDDGSAPKVCRRVLLVSLV